jgi:hypothetical protein
VEEVRTSAAADRCAAVVHSVVVDHCGALVHSVVVDHCGALVHSVVVDRCVVVVHGAPADPILVTRIEVVVAVAAQMVQAARNADLVARCVVRGEVQI